MIICKPGKTHVVPDYGSPLDTTEAATHIDDQLPDMRLYQDTESTVMARVQLVMMDDEVAIEMYL